MKVIETKIPGLLVFEPKVFGDHRGFFYESYNLERYLDAGLKAVFVQDNVSKSSHGVLRGLHFQSPEAQGKLVSVLDGQVFDVAVDIRHGSPTFGQWFGITLDSEKKNQFFVPPGFAHGFVVTSPTAVFTYKCTHLYRPQFEHSILWNDPDLGIQWPIQQPSLSAKDQVGIRLRDFPVDKLPVYKHC